MVAGSVAGSVPAQLLPVGCECRQRLNCFLHFPQRTTALSPGDELEGRGRVDLCGLGTLRQGLTASALQGLTAVGGSEALRARAQWGKP